MEGFHAFSITSNIGPLRGPEKYHSITNLDPLHYTAFEKVWALPNLFTRVYTRLEVVWSPKPLRCRYSGVLLEDERYT